ncbi:hypothetical protein C0995_003601 [Termitomyces sp. Mi166|nr:hypothetical protein C0995_003601 [Termitomyces sp. Mi166\
MSGFGEPINQSSRSSEKGRPIKDHHQQSRYPGQNMASSSRQQPQSYLQLFQPQQLEHSVTPLYYEVPLQGSSYQVSHCESMEVDNKAYQLHELYYCPLSPNKLNTLCLLEAICLMIIWISLGKRHVCSIIVEASQGALAPEAEQTQFALSLSKSKEKGCTNEPMLADDQYLAEILQRLENAGHFISAEAEFLQDLDDSHIDNEKQHQMVLNQISRKKALSFQNMSSKSKQLKVQVPESKEAGHLLQIPLSCPPPPLAIIVTSYMIVAQQPLTTKQSLRKMVAMELVSPFTGLTVKQGDVDIVDMRLESKPQKSTPVKSRPPPLAAIQTGELS